MRIRLFLLSLGLLVIASASHAGVLPSGEHALYNMTFDAPFQTSGLEVQTDNAGIPRRGPSAVFGEVPLIEVIEQPFTEQQMVIGPAGGPSSFVRMQLTDLDPLDPEGLVFNRYSIVMVFSIDGLAGTNNSITLAFIGADELEATSLVILSNGAVFSKSGQNAGLVDTGATIEEGTTYRLETIFDLNLGLWAVFLDQDEIVGDDFTPLTALTDVQIIAQNPGAPSLRMETESVLITGFEDGFVEPSPPPADSNCTGDPVLDSPANPIELYDVTFNSPLHVPGEFPTLDFGTPSRDGISGSGGDAFIASEIGSDTDNSLLLLGRGDSITTSNSRARFDVSSTGESGLGECYERYILEFDVTVLDIGDSTDSFSIRGAGGTTNSITFGSSGQIVASHATDKQTVSEVLAGQQWRGGRRDSWRIEFDIEMQKWRVFRGVALIHAVDVDMDYLTWIDFDLLDIGQSDSGVLIDDVRIWGASGFTPGANDLNEDGAVDARDMAFGLQQELLDVDSARDLLDALGFDANDFATLKKWKKPVNKYYSREVVPRFGGQRSNNLKNQDKALLAQVWQDEQLSLDDITDTGLPDANNDTVVDEADMALVLEKGNIGDTARALAILDAMGFSPADFSNQKKWKKKMTKLYKQKIQKEFFEKRHKLDKQFDKAYLTALY